MSKMLLDIDRGRRKTLAGVLFLTGIALTGAGSYVHFRAAALLRTKQHCFGCSIFLWHPLFVVAPLVIGLGFVLISGYLLHRL